MTSLSTCSFPVLIAEDNRLMRTILETTLRHAGYAVTATDNGGHAWELFQGGYYPIVISDWVMPEMDGLELCRHIRAEYADRYTYIILLTSLDSRDDLIIGLEAGADEYLVKPVNQAELMVRLKTACRILELERRLTQSVEELRQTAIKDPLTTLYNRRYLDEHLPMEIKRAARYLRPLAVIMGDIDHFKEINDTYGHQCGDEVLRAFSNSLKDMVRLEIDLLVRYGGEEFLIILPETEHHGAMVLAERLRQGIAARKFLVQGKEIGVTASFGVASYRPTTHLADYSMIQRLLEKADGCLYEAKNNGRNQCRGAECEGNAARPQAG